MKNYIKGSRALTYAKADVAGELDKMLDDAIYSALDNVAIVLSSRVKSYDVDWCADESLDVVDSKIEQAKSMIISALLRELFAKYQPKYFYDNAPLDSYWYRTTHGVQPGSIPKGANVLDVVDTPHESFVLLDKLLTQEALDDFDLTERAPN